MNCSLYTTNFGRLGRLGRLAVVVPLILILLAGCSPAANAPATVTSEPSAVLPTAVPTATPSLTPSQSPNATPTVRPTRTPRPTAELLPGDPVPATLEGFWYYDLRGLTMWLHDYQYSLDQVDQVLIGNVVVNGDEIDFYNAGPCNIPLPGGVGRYTWKITGEELLLTPIEYDPCGRREYLANVTFTRVH
jgi:uncharacterized protein YcfL